MNETTHNDEPDDGDYKALTLFTDPDEPLVSQYGTLRYEDWCQREIKRIRKSGGDATMLRNARGQVAVGRM